jgi:hypothetical protein
MDFKNRFDIETATRQDTIEYLNKHINKSFIVTKCKYVNYHTVKIRYSFELERKVWFDEQYDTDDFIRFYDEEPYLSIIPNSEIGRLANIKTLAESKEDNIEQFGKILNWLEHTKISSNFSLIFIPIFINQKHKLVEMLLDSKIDRNVVDEYVKNTKVEDISPEMRKVLEL